jgi:hypothetical protein
LYLNVVSSILFVCYGLRWLNITYLSYIMAFSFIGEGNQSTWRKPIIYRRLYHQGWRIPKYTEKLHRPATSNWQTLSHKVVLRVEGTNIPREPHQPATSHWQTLSHKVVLRVEGTKIPREPHQPATSHWQTLSH